MAKLEPITEKDLEQVSQLAADCFCDDPFFEQLSKNKDKRITTLQNIYRESIRICIQYGDTFGMKNEKEFISFICYFNYNKLKNCHPNEYAFIFNESKYSKSINKVLSKEKEDIDKIINDNAEYLYLLAIGVKKEYQRKNYAKKLIQTIQQTYPNYILFTDASNETSIKLFENLGFEFIKNSQGCSFLHHIPHNKKLTIDKENPVVSLAVPRSLNLENIGIDVLQQEFATINHIHTVGGQYPYFRYSCCTSSKLRIIQITYEDLTKYQRYINVALFDELKIVWQDKIVLLYATFSELNHFNNLDLYPNKKEWDIISDVYTGIPIQYTDKEKLQTKYSPSLLVNLILKTLDFRTTFEAGIIINDIDKNKLNSNKFKDRIKRFYLGKIQLQIFESPDIEFFNFASKNNPSSHPIDVEMIIAIDEQTECGVLYLISLSCGFLITHYLDMISNNQIKVVKGENTINLYQYLSEEFGIEKKGAAKNFLTIFKNREEIIREKQDVMASILFCEMYFEDGVYLSNVVDKNIMKVLSDKNGIAQYNYATVYVFHNMLVQMSKSFQTDLQERIKQETTTLFYIELILFELSAIGIANDRSIQYLADIDNKEFNPKKVLEKINSILSEYVKSIEFWNVQLNYPSSKRSMENIRKHFAIEKEKTIFQRNKRELLMIYDMRSDIVDKYENMLITTIMAILAAISAISTICDVSTIKKGFITSLVALCALFFYRKCLSKTTHYKGQKTTVNRNKRAN